MSILVIDDDRDLVRLVVYALRRDGFDTAGAYDLPAARRLLRDNPPELIVLDRQLGPGVDGLDFLAELRRTNRVPVILLTQLVTEEDRVRGLELGADDYLPKPFSHRELAARIRAVLRRTNDGPVRRAAPELRAGHIVLDPAAHRVHRAGEPVGLSVTEFRLLHYLLTNAGVVVPTGDLLRHIWGYGATEGTDIVRVAIHRLRRKLGDDGAEPRLIITVPGVGILLRADG